MGKYIYESHMGSLYTTSVEQTPDMLYCEQCGDSNHLVGYANDLQEAWALLKPKTNLFDAGRCIGCSHKEDYDYCNEHCENYAASGGYSLAWIMEFLHEEFPEDNTWHFVYLLMKHQDNGKEYYVARCSHNNHKFGEKHSFPVGVCMNGDYVGMIANALVIYGGQVDLSTLKCVATKYTRDGVIHIYECVDTKPESDNWREAASCFDDNWYGYFEKEALNLIDAQELVFCDIL